MSLAGANNIWPAKADLFLVNPLLENLNDAFYFDMQRAAGQAVAGKLGPAALARARLTVVRKSLSISHKTAALYPPIPARRATKA
ncbi:MAG: hypothetical protein H7317_16540 [Pseudorhodobacter sp.]|nr:hypothetical protein [Pseudorhodobacter sp.]